MMPSFITGSITAWGGGWNALIVSEYVQFNGTTYHTFGIGDLIDKATFDHPDAPDYSLLALSVVAMVVFIVLANRLVWKRLYRRAITKYQLEG
jgi:NitT/TauT family transport system permease protein